MNNLARETARPLLFGLFTLLVALASPAAHAQESFADNVRELIRFTPNPEGDIIQRSFQQLFGDFIFIPFGGTSGTGTTQITLLSHVLGYTNVLAFFLGVIILSYVFVGGAIRTAHEGEVLGRQWSKVWVPIRNAVGFGLITPAQGIGGGVFSIIQVIIIWLILVGSNAGSILWEKTASWIAGGAPIVTTNDRLTMRAPREMFEMLVCAQSYREESAGLGFFAKIANGFRDSNEALITVYWKKEEGGWLDKLKQRDSEKYKENLADFSFTTLPNQHQIDEIRFGGDGKCGSIILQATEHDQNKHNYEGKAYNIGFTVGREIIFETLEKLIPIAAKVPASGALQGGKKIKDELEAGTDEDYLNQVHEAAKSYLEAAKNYVERLPKEVHDKVIVKSDLGKQWFSEISTGGWGRAGLYYHEVSKFASLTGNILKSIDGGIGDSTVPSTCTVTSLFDCEESKVIAVDISAAGSIHALAVEIASNSNRGELARSVDMEKIVGYCTLDSCETKENSTSLLVGRLQEDVRSIAWARGLTGHLQSAGMPSTGLSGASGNLANPFAVVSSIGHAMNGYAEIAWHLGLVISTAQGSMEGSLQALAPKAGGAALAPFIGAVMGAGKYILASVVSVIMLLLPMGVTLAYVVPYLPVIVWIMLISSYLLTCVEAVVAAPLAVIMMVTPEGEGITGARMERAIALLAMTILRPSLLVVGLVASISLSFVTFGIMNSIFWDSTHLIAGNADFAAGKGSVLGQSAIEFFAIMAIYTSTAFQLTKLSVGIMHKLADQILEWFTGNVARQFGENEMGNIVASSTSGVERGLGSVAGGMGNALSRRGDDHGRGISRINPEGGDSKGSS